MLKIDEQDRERAEALVNKFLRAEISEKDLIDGIIAIGEKVSYAYDPRLPQNRNTGPVIVRKDGRYMVRRAPSS